MMTPQQLVSQSLSCTLDLVVGVCCTGAGAGAVCRLVSKLGRFFSSSSCNVWENLDGSLSVIANTSFR